MKRVFENSVLKPLPLWKVANIKHEKKTLPGIGEWKTHIFTPVEKYEDIVRYEDILYKFHTGSKKFKTTTKEHSSLTTFTLGLRPTLKQRQAMDLQIHVTNHTYNWCVWLVQIKGKKLIELQSVVVTNKQEKVPPELRMPVDLKTDKGELVTPVDQLTGNDDWFFQPLKCNTCTKLTALKRFKSNYLTAKKKYGSKATMKYKVENLQVPIDGVFGVQKSYVKWVDDQHLEIMPGTMAGTLEKKGFERDRKVRVNKRHKIPPIQHDVTIVKRPNNKYVLSIPCKPQWTRSASGHPDRQNICGIDPGIRTFLTGVDCTNGSLFEFGTTEKKTSQLKKFYNKEDTIRSFMAKAKENQQMTEFESRKRQLRKLLYKRRQIVDMLHRQAIAHLVKNYRLVSLGKINIKSIVYKDKSKQRNINKHVSRDAYAWSHFKFRMRLLERSEGTDCHVVIQDEQNTSKTCCKCGKKKDLGGDKTYICEHCGLVTGRDVNGAINILRKTLNIF